MAKVHSGKKYCRKLQTPEKSARTLQTDDRQTDGFAVAKTQT